MDLLMGIQFAPRKFFVNSYWVLQLIYYSILLRLRVRYLTLTFSFKH